MTTRLLIVDDSATVRRIVGNAIKGDSQIEIVGFAENGEIALEKIEQLKPDVILLDVEMPKLDGLGVLKELGKRKLMNSRILPVLMFSTLTERGASVTLDALSLGAMDYLAKPTDLGSQEAVAEYLKNELIPRIKMVGQRAASSRTPSVAVQSVAHQLAHNLGRGHLNTTAKGNGEVARPSSNSLTSKRQRIDVVAIGCSTGGPEALKIVLRDLPKNFPVPIVIVQHMAPVFTKTLAQRLAATSSIRVVEGVNGQELEPGLAIVAPGGFHMRVSNKSSSRPLVLLNQDPPENSCRPAVDVLFRSIASSFGRSSYGVVLTGMGVDGVSGAKAIVDVGGEVVAQDQESSVVWGMPGAVVQANLASSILSLDEIAPTLMRRVHYDRKEMGMAHG